ncbi:Non-specific serine/threonine protein kinase [Aphelenchoides besseyi]|nr:Non-specific serine/threonine protein kinase [Aphelenchoides besseyi]
MGNVQTASIANQILPTESLGATRFLKTVCVKSDDGLAVIKVFVLSEEVPHLDEHLSRISHIRRKLKDSPNCLPYTKTFVRCVIVHRPLRKFTLYERLSTRPFLLEIEKLWIAYQLLKGLSQCRMNGTRHGDIKSQNILVSSTGWVQLADFAPFKPAFIPYDNPSTFTFFFDTSRRRTCYIAPERFKSADELNYAARRPEDFPKEDGQLNRTFCLRFLRLFVEFSNHEKALEANGTEAVVLFINVVTANIRACHSMAMKMDAIGLLKKFATLADSSVGMLTDYYAQVRGESLIAITEMLEMMTIVPYDESRLLVDYLFQKLKKLTDDPCDFVKITLANCLGRLSMISLRFFNEACAKLNDSAKLTVDFQGTDEPDKDTVDQIINSERSALQDAISEIFVNLCGASSFVRQTLFANENLQLLCEFFGSNKAVDVLMHMITLLNDKEDWSLRATFFVSCPTVAAHSTTIRNSKLVPFLQQNKWYRAQVVNILTVLDSIFTVADVYCELIPLVRPYLTEPLIRLTDNDVVFSCLVEPIPRQIWDLVIGYDKVTDLLREFEEQRTLDKLGGGRYSFFSAGLGESPESPPRRPTRLDSTGTTLADSGLEILLKNKRDEKSPTHDYRIQLSSLPLARRMVFDLETGTHRAVRLKGSVPAHLADVAKEWIDAPDLTRRPLEVPFEMAVSSKMQLAEAFAHKQQRYQEQRRVTNSLSFLPPRDPKDAAAIPVQLATHPHDEIFASCSADSTVKIWPVSQARLKNQPAILSKETYRFSYVTNSIAFMQNNGNHLAMGRENSELMIQDIVYHRPLRSFPMDPNDDGPVTQIYSAPNGSRSQLLLEPIFYQRARKSCGWVTGFSIDTINQHWMLLTTSSSTTKNMILWDLRFGGLEVTSWQHPGEHNVTPFRSWTYAMDRNNCSSVLTNSAKSGELSVWDLRTRGRTEILWPSGDRPYDYNRDFVSTAVVTCPELNGIFTGDSEGSLRFWNMNGHANRSNYLSGPYRKFAGHWTANEIFGPINRVEDKRIQRIDYSFPSVRNDEPRLQVENRADRPLSEAEFPTVPHVSDCHRNAVTDMIAVGADQLISSSIDGVVKIWKVHAA